MAQNQRHLDIELIRIIACFFVIFNHTGEDGFFLFSRYDWKSISFWIYLMISIFCKCSVPLFFAVTGALLLEKEETAGRLWRHRIGRTGRARRHGVAFTLVSTVSESLRMDDIQKNTGNTIRPVHFNERGDLVASVERA